MKKTFRILYLLFALILSTVSFAHAEIPDISDLSYDELVALKAQINLTIWNSQEWQEVTVPQGVWKVGVDIPAGTWTVKCADLGRNDNELRFCLLSWGDTLDANGTGIEFSDCERCGTVSIWNPYGRYYNEGGVTEYYFTFKDGDYIVIHNVRNKAVFTPYTGKPDLGFK